jgi:hypothetical protein
MSKGTAFLLLLVTVYLPKQFCLFPVHCHLCWLPANCPCYETFPLCLALHVMGIRCTTTETCFLLLYCSLAGRDLFSSSPLVHSSACW